MLYKTHQRYGLLSGLMGIPVLVSIGTIPVVTLGMRFTDAILVSFLIVYAVISALFGSEFPDCDSYGGLMDNGEYKKGSIPSQKHPIISSIFRFFKIKHRGKFSHDYASLTFFFGLLYVIQRYGLLFLQNKMIETQSSAIAIFVNISTLLLLYFLANELKMKYTFSKKGRKNKNPLIKNFLTVGFFVFLYLLTTLGGFTSFSFVNYANALSTLVFLRTILNVVVIFTWIGSMSHLFADMATNEGVYFFGKRLSPAKVIISLTKYPFVPVIGFLILGFFIGYIKGAVIGAIVGFAVYHSIKTTKLRTDSAYEDLCYLIVTILCIPATIVLVISLTGGDVMSFLRLLGFPV